ncbi:hypothetical protein Tco_1545529 [Tanacetum coccineum]
MSSDNASSVVTYTSVSSDSNEPSSWGIPLVNAGELPEMDSYKEHVLVYVPEPEHPKYHAPSDDDIQVEDQPYANDASPIAESPGYIANSNTMEEDTDEDSINYLNKPGTDDEDHEEDDDEDPEVDHEKEHDPEDEDEDPEEDPSEEHEPEDEDAKEDEPSEDSNETKPFEENETAATPPPPPRSPQTRVFFFSDMSP